MLERYVSLQVNRGTFEQLAAIALRDGEPFGIYMPDDDGQETMKLYIGVHGKAVPVAACAGLTPISVGETLSLPPGSAAQVENLGSHTNVRLRFSIPEGVQGQRGAAFDYADFTAEQLVALKGERGHVGAVGATGESAYRVWLSSGNMGTVEDFLRSLRGDRGDMGDMGDAGMRGEQGDRGLVGATGSKGERGDKGDTGERGVAAFTLSVQGAVSLPSGSAPYGMNVGTALDPVLLFGIPVGEVGATGSSGAKGDTGARGATGAAGVNGAKGDKGDKGDAGSLPELFDLGTY